jgi:hypothetical protein
MTSHPEIVPVLAWFLVSLSGLSLVALLLKASTEYVTEEAATVLSIIAIIAGAAAAILLPSLRFRLGIFCLVIAALAGVILCIRAIVDEVATLGGVILLMLFIFLGAIGYLLMAWF